MILLYTFLYITINAILSILGVDNHQEMLKVFFIGLLLTPVAGIGYLIFRKRNQRRIHFYYCEQCDYIFPVKMKNCPICEEQGKKVKLLPYKSPYHLNTKILSLT